MGEREGLNRGSVQNRCNQPRTLCFNSLDAAPMSAYVAARSYISLPHGLKHVHTRVQRVALQQSGASARIYVCITSTGTLLGIIDPPGITDIPRPTLSRTRAYPRLYERLSSLFASLFSFQSFSSKSSSFVICIHIHNEKQLQDRFPYHVNLYICCLCLFTFFVIYVCSMYIHLG